MPIAPASQDSNPEALPILDSAFQPRRDANSFGRGIIYHPQSGVWRSCVKLANWSLALAISVFSFTAFSTPSAQTQAVHKPQPQRTSSALQGHWTGSLQPAHAVLHLSRI